MHIKVCDITGCNNGGLEDPLFHAFLIMLGVLKECTVFMFRVKNFSNSA